MPQQLGGCTGSERVLSVTALSRGQQAVSGCRTLRFRQGRPHRHGAACWTGQEVTDGDRAQAERPPGHVECARQGDKGVRCSIFFTP